MFGLACMAARLAYSRGRWDTRWGWQPPDQYTPDECVPRAELRPGDGYAASHEYYAICDRIARGEQP